MTEYDRTDYEWRVLHNGTEGKTPNVRANGVSWVYDDSIWLVCGASAGLGKASDVWKFTLATKLWEKVIVSGDPPTFRDSCSGAYMGEGKFIIFGGQGFPEHNAKLGKGAGENSRVKTYNKREVYNDLFQLDCATLQWSHIYPNGLTFPMGRRGHSSIFISSPLGYPSSGSSDKNDSNSTVGSDGSSHKQNISRSQSRQSTREGGRSRAANRHNTGVQILDEIPTNTLVVFGGSGIELSKYTEQIYNDLWLFSMDTMCWTRLVPKGGVEPKPLFDHSMERVGDSLVIIGGISGAVKTTVHASQDTATNTDVMIFNMRTSIWSFVKLWEPSGQPARFSLHGFSTALDVTNTDHPQSIIVFGGRDIVTKTAASISRTTPVPCSTGRNFSKSNTNTFIIDLTDSSITPVKSATMLPSDRYGHMGMAAASVDVLCNQYKPSAFPTKPLKRQMTLRKKSPLTQTPHRIEAMKYVFGGANMERGGFTDPVLYALMRIRSAADNPYVPARPVTTNSSVPSPVSELGHTGLDDASCGDESMEYSRDGDDSRAESRSLFYREGDDDDFSQDDGGGNSLSTTESQDYLSKPSSIWANVQMQQNGGSKNGNGINRMDIKQPTNWLELKLAISAPLSQRFFEGTGLSMMNTNSIPMDDATTSGSTITTAFSSSTRRSGTAKGDKRVAMTAPDSILGSSASTGSFNQSSRTGAGSMASSLDGGYRRPSTTASGGSGSMKGSTLMQSGSSVMDNLSATGSRPTTSQGESETGTPPRTSASRDQRKKKISELKAIIEPISVDNKTKHEVRGEFRQLFG